ncbi:hypothetical protein ACIRBZ_08370 [Streptomyces sp. NPDC094038]|uniref:hypothetical protein n=1 Tax=Streptomyces sp. NPDC094038 TaxID=3366055 RepID=UPI00381EEC51
MRLGKALATGVAEERPLVHDDVPELSEESREVQGVEGVEGVQQAREIRAARGVSEEASAAR